MKTYIILLTLISLESLARENIYLTPGGAWQSPPLSTQEVWVENSKVLKAKVQSQRLLIKAKAPGQSLLRIGKDSYLFTVAPESLITQFKKLSSLSLEDSPYTYSLSEQAIHVLSGIYTLSDWDKVYNSLKSTPWVLEAKLSSSVRISVLNTIRRKLKDNNLPYVYIQTDGRWRVLLRPKDPRLNQYKNILNAHGVAVLEDSDALPASPLVRVRITIAEVRRDFTQKLGIQWPNQVTASVIPPDINANLDPLFFSAQALEKDGKGKILASPNLLVKSGDEGRFFAGGEFPIKILTPRSQKIEWKEYGIQLKVKPQTDPSGRMALEIQTEVSNVDTAGAIDGIPALSHHKVASSFTLNESKTIVLSGLIKNEESNTIQGLPGLSQIPILGRLFSSNDFKENRSELLIFVRPEIVDEQSYFEHKNLDQEYETTRNNPSDT